MKRSPKDDKAAAALARQLLDGTPVERVAAAGELTRRAADLQDIRGAQPALAVAMVDPDPLVRRAAVEATHERVMASGCDVRLAFPALSFVVHDEDAETRRLAWATVSIADGRRHSRFLPPFRAAALAALHDPDDEVRHYASRILAEIGRSGDVTSPGSTPSRT